MGEGSAPGIEIGGGQIVPGTVGEDGQAALLPTCQVPTPELLLTGIAGLALSHGKDLQDMGKENRVPKVTADTRMGWTVGLLLLGSHY